MTQNATPEHDGFDEIKYRNSFAKPSTPPNDWADETAGMLAFALAITNKQRADVASVIRHGHRLHAPAPAAGKGAEELEAMKWLNEPACCNGNECGCMGTSRLQLMIFEEFGHNIEPLKVKLAASEARATAAEKRCAELMHELNRLVPVLGEVDAEIVQGLLATKTAGKGGAS